MMMTVCPFVTFVPFVKHCLNNVPATGAVISTPPVATGAAAVVPGTAEAVPAAKLTF